MPEVPEQMSGQGSVPSCFGRFWDIPGILAGITMGVVEGRGGLLRFMAEVPHGLVLYLRQWTPLRQILGFQQVVPKNKIVMLLLLLASTPWASVSPSVNRGM